jgi:hypothetical protein
MRRALLAFALTFVIVSAVYRRVPIAFLRAESGWFLCLSHSDEAAQRAMVRGFFTHSSAGHYTPLAFFSEFATAKIVGTSRTFWKWRQLLVVSAVGAVLFALVAALARVLTLSTTQQLAIALVLTAAVLFQPTMIDWVTCPFMVMQLGWLGLSAGALFCLAQIFSRAARPRWAWLAAGAAYASLHLSGLGLVTVAGTAAALVWFAFRRHDAMRHQALRSCGLMLIFALIHAAMMLRSGAASPANEQFTDFLFALKYSLGFIFNFVVAGLLSFAFTSPHVPDAYSIAYCWPLGLALVVFGAVGLAQYLRWVRNRSTPGHELAAMLLLFSTSGFATMMALIGARSIIIPHPYTVLPWLLVVSRYTIPLQFLFVGPVILVLAWFVRRRPRLGVIGCCLLFPALIATQLAYQKNAMPFLIPGSRASHYTCWRLLVAAARECRAAGLPLPNFSMAPLTREFSEANVETFLPLLRHDLRLPPDEKIELAPLQDYRNDPERYRPAPSVKAFEQKLELARD